MTLEHGQVQIVLLAGPEDPLKAQMGLNVALAAQSTGAETALFIGLRATYWACEASVGVDGNQSIHALIDRILEAGGTVECCGTCAEKHCFTGSAGHGIALRQGITYAGFVTIASRAAMGVNTLTF